tara:strand:- start:12082 stop:12417 length:336 start_codon:yes stop_codon:yes gene_type:complete
MKKYLVLMLVLFSAQSFGGGFTGTIRSIVCHEQNVSPTCQISVNGVPTGQPVCATSSWRFSFDGTTIEGRNMLSIMLAAQVSKQKIAIGGKGYCSVSSASEDVRHVYIIAD